MAILASHNLISVTITNCRIMQPNYFLPFCSCSLSDSLFFGLPRLCVPVGYNSRSAADVCILMMIACLHEVKIGFVTRRLVAKKKDTKRKIKCLCNINATWLASSREDLVKWSSVWTKWQWNKFSRFLTFLLLIIVTPCFLLVYFCPMRCAVTPVSHLRLSWRLRLWLDTWSRYKCYSAEPTKLHLFYGYTLKFFLNKTMNTRKSRVCVCVCVTCGPHAAPTFVAEIMSLYDEK
jgi:hypothetical protein